MSTTRKKNGGDLTPDMVDLLRVMVLRQEETNKALLGLAQVTGTRLDKVSGQLEALTAEVRGTNKKLEALAGEVGQGRDHGTRIQRLERAVFKKTGT